MFDLVGYWGIVSLYTYLLVVVPLSYLSFFAVLHLYSIATEKEQYKRSLCSDFKDKVIALPLFRHLFGDYHPVSWISSLLAVVSICLAHDYMLAKDIPFSFVGSVAYVAEHGASLASGFTILALFYLALRLVVSRVYTTAKKLSAVMHKLGESND